MAEALLELAVDLVQRTGQRLRWARRGLAVERHTPPVAAGTRGNRALHELHQTIVQLHQRPDAPDLPDFFRYAELYGKVLPWMYYTLVLAAVENTLAHRTQLRALWDRARVDLELWTPQLNPAALQQREREQRAREEARAHELARQHLAQIEAQTRGRVSTLPCRGDRTECSTANTGPEIAVSKKTSTEQAVYEPAVRTDPKDLQASSEAEFTKMLSMIQRNSGESVRASGKRAGASKSTADRMVNGPFPCDGGKVRAFVTACGLAPEQVDAVMSIWKDLAAGRQRGSEPLRSTTVPTTPVMPGTFRQRGRPGAVAYWNDPFHRRPA